jgi:hypothetical protein
LPSRDIIRGQVACARVPARIYVKKRGDDAMRGSSFLPLLE